MNIEQQVCGREYSEKLEKFGVPQKSVWYWFKDHRYVQYKNDRQWKRDRLKKEWGLISFKISEDCISAFTVAELGEILPGWVNTVRTGKRGKKDYWQCWQVDSKNIKADTEANARAKMKIYLLENNL